MAQADKAWEEAQVETAITCYLQALQLIPDEVFPDKSRHIYHNLGCFYHIQPNLEEAQRCFQQALRLFPQSNTYCDYGLFLLSCKKLDEAYAQFMLAKERNDSSELGYGPLGKPQLDDLLQNEFKFIPLEENSFSISAQLMCRYQLVYCSCLLGNIEQQQEVLQDLINYSEGCSDDEKEQAQRLVEYAKQHIKKLANKNESVSAIESEHEISTAILSTDMRTSSSFFQPVNHSRLQGQIAKPALLQQPQPYRH